MKMLDELAARMKDKNLSEIARRCNMARDNITRIARRQQDDMRISSYVKLTEVLDQMDEEKGDE